MNLSDNDLGQDFISTLGPNSLVSLLELSLSNTRLTNKSIGDLSDYLTDYKLALLNLDLSSNLFTVEGYFKLLTALKQNQSALKKVNLSRNNFGFDQHTEIQPGYFSITEQFVSQNKSIEELNLNECKMGADGAAILGKSLRRNQKIQRLYLSQNKFEDKGIFYILEGVLDNI